APSIISFSRILLVGVLWWLALTLPQENVLFAAVFLLCVTTDAVDGYVARRWKLESKVGAKLDNVADTLVYLSLVPWISLLIPELLLDNLVVIGVILAIYLADLALQYLRHGKRVPLHLLSGKLASALLFVFIIHSLVFDVNPFLKWLTFGVIFFCLFEEIYLLATRRDLDETVISAFMKLRRAVPE
ncbi:MAG: CDP-alcohol phosphatidyltransferase family protein, partial [Armatimonadetes bacterium]|nr:CDP-alcohol phosphatidyltransferase family protein [Armatimonadota bacterium]